MMSIVHALIANPTLVLRQRNIFLLSHMRANTSLFGHLVGSHPEIEGYYEMHIGYHSWKSLWRQKMRHFENHAPKAGARYMFDKILHDGHHVSTAILQRDTSRAIFMLREPEQSIKSLVALYRERTPQPPESTPAGATRYYVDRLQTLGRIASELGHRYFYLDAEAIIDNTETTLASLSDWLSLSGPIPSTYGAFALTGHRKVGDPSARLKSGKIERGGNGYAGIALDPDLLAAACAAYEHSRQQLLAESERNAIRSPPDARAALSRQPNCA
jgi:hypothetical protein